MQSNKSCLTLPVCIVSILTCHLCKHHTPCLSDQLFYQKKICPDECCTASHPSSTNRCHRNKLLLLFVVRNKPLNCHSLYCFGFSIAFSSEKEEAVIRTTSDRLNILRERQLYVLYTFNGLVRFQSKKLWKKITQLCQLGVLLYQLPKIKSVKYLCLSLYIHIPHHTELALFICHLYHKSKMPFTNPHLFTCCHVTKLIPPPKPLQKYRL